jgi:hypothetical protein
VQITRDYISESSFFVDESAGTCFLRAGKAENVLVFEVKTILKNQNSRLTFLHRFF